MIVPLWQSVTPLIVIRGLFNYLTLLFQLMVSAKVLLQLSLGGEEGHENPYNKLHLGWDLKLGPHEYKEEVLTTQNDCCGWLDKTSALCSGSSMFNSQLGDQLS